VADERAECRLPGEQHIGSALPGALGIRDRQARDEHAHDRSGQQHPPFDMRPQQQGGPADPGAGQSRGQADGQRPAELRDIGPAEMRQTGNRYGERPEAGPGVHAYEDQRTDPRSEQAGDQHEPQRGSAQSGGLHQQERAENRRAEQRADGGEASRRSHYRPGAVRHVALGEPDGQEAQAAADRDERRLRS
jgi:hypothetical protein